MVFEIELIQQSPIIHFQSDEPGATLRASEVKPKLDRFLLDRIGGFDELWKDNKMRGWLIGYSDEGYEKAVREGKAEEYKSTFENKPALNYKIRFYADETSVRRSNTRKAALEKLIDNNGNDLSRDALRKAQEFINRHRSDNLYMPKVYFGNMVNANDNNEKVDLIISQFKEALLYTRPVLMKIVCYIPDLIELIKRSLTRFFTVENFGCRSDKGTGSFIPNNRQVDCSKVGEWLTQQADAPVCYVISYDEADVNRQFNDISTLYSVMKSGYNHETDRYGCFLDEPDKYCRSFLFDYFHSLGIGNEKRFLKDERISPYFKRQRYNDIVLDNEPIHHPHNTRKHEGNTNPPCYVRAVLGVGDNIDYNIGYRFARDGFTAKRGNNGKVNIENVNPDKDEKIERFASPLFFKIIGDKTYIVANRVNNRILNEKFIFSSRCNSYTLTGKTLSTPKAFDIDDFMDKFVTWYNNDRVRTKEYGIRRIIEEAYRVRGAVNG